MASVIDIIMSLVVSLRLVLIFVRRHVSPASHRCKCRAIFYGALWQEMRWLAMLLRA